MNRRSRGSPGWGLVILVLLVLAAVVLGAWYESPYLTLRAMRAAARDRDAGTFNQYVDYPRLRASLKGEFEGRVERAFGGSDGGGAGTGAGENAVQQAGASLGKLIGDVVVDRAIEALVRPGTVMAALNAARLRGPGVGGSADDADSGAGAGSGVDAGGGHGPGSVRWRIERQGMDRVVAYGERADQPDGAGRYGFVFEREELLHWRLTGIELPRQRAE